MKITKFEDIPLPLHKHNDFIYLAAAQLRGEILEIIATSEPQIKLDDKCGEYFWENDDDTVCLVFQIELTEKTQQAIIQHCLNNCEYLKKDTVLPINIALGVKPDINQKKPPLSKHQKEILDKLENHGGKIRGEFVSNTFTLYWKDQGFQPTAPCREKTIRKLIELRLVKITDSTGGIFTYESSKPKGKKILINENNFIPVQELGDIPEKTGAIGYKDQKNYRCLPAHAVKKTLSPRYFCPPGRDDGFVDEVLAFFEGEPFTFKRKTATSPWRKQSQ